MPVPRATIEHNLIEVRRRIADAATRAGRSPEAVRLVAVTKTVGIEEAQSLIALGQTDLGENRVDAGKSKIETIGTEGVRWHMIGNIQRRKARDVVTLFDYIHAVDRVPLAEALERRCEEQHTTKPILLEVNVSGETAKHGFEPQQVAAAIKQIMALPHLEVQGLMTMAPWVEDPEETRPFFQRLRQLAEEFGVRELSMGMTNDFEVAVEEGATQVRIGTALFT